MCIGRRCCLGNTRGYLVSTPNDSYVTAARLLQLVVSADTTVDRKQTLRSLFFSLLSGGTAIQLLRYENVTMIFILILYDYCYCCTVKKKNSRLTEVVVFLLPLCIVFCLGGRVGVMDGRFIFFLLYFGLAHQTCVRRAQSLACAVVLPC